MPAQSVSQNAVKPFGKQRNFHEPYAELPSVSSLDKCRRVAFVQRQVHFEAGLIREEQLHEDLFSG